MRTDEWETPDALFGALHAEFGFTIDVCASPANAKLPRYWTQADDALLQDWAGERCWMNPPYGRPIAKWIRKAHQESERGALVVCLVPASTDTAWWHDYCVRGVVRFLRGRLCFRSGERSGRAPFPSAVVIFGAGAASC
jgi:site-specific DNA-methyltransferase (adenine-specific)